MHLASFRAVFDPGVLVSAALSPAGTPAELVEVWKDGGFELVVSEALLGELEEVLLRPKFRRRLTEAEVHEYVGRFGRLARVAPDPEIVPGITPDPKDDYLVALARSSGAHFLTSGDYHEGRVLWHGRERPVVVLAAGEAADPLVGTALLHGSRLEIDFVDGGSVVIEPLP